MLFRTGVLDLALPFPYLATSTQVHDHWVAVCAASRGPVLVVDTVLQDYVQHGGNVLGEATGGFNLFRSLHRVSTLALKFEGGNSPAKVARYCWSMSFGWRQVMADALRHRESSRSSEMELALAAFSSERKWVQTFRVLSRGAANRNIALSVVAEFLAGFPMEVVRRLAGKATR